MDANNEPAAHAGEPDWGPFGRPLFNDAAARALSRVGVVDVGSNSVRLVVFDGAARSPAYFYNEKIMCALGAGLSDTGRLNPEGRVRALSALRRGLSVPVSSPSSWCRWSAYCWATPWSKRCCRALLEPAARPSFASR